MSPMATKEAQRAYQSAWAVARRAAWIEANGPCQHCGSTEDLQVDHKDRLTKVTHRVWTWSKERRDAELSKCHVLCHPCHVEKTWTVDFQRAPHGTPARYKRGCRCEGCRAAHADDIARWRAKRARIRLAA